MSSIIEKPTDLSDVPHKRSNRGRKRKACDVEVERRKLVDIEDEESRKRQYNNIAVRKSRDKGKCPLRFQHIYYWSDSARIRHQERDEKLMTLSQENNALKNAVKRRNQDLDALRADYERLKCYVQSLPPHLVPSWLITRASPPLGGACSNRNSWTTCYNRKKPVETCRALTYCTCRIP